MSVRSQNNYNKNSQPDIMNKDYTTPFTFKLGADCVFVYLLALFVALLGGILQFPAR